MIPGKATGLDIYVKEQHLFACRSSGKHKATPLPPGFHKELSSGGGFPGKQRGRRRDSRLHRLKS